MISLHITINELLNIQNPKIIDIREPKNYTSDHIDDAINIPYNKILINPGKYLNKNENYYLYCEHGKTSSSLCHILNAQGYHTYSITGGYETWKAKKI